MACWKSRDILMAAFHHETCGSSGQQQQLRALVTLVLALADPGSGGQRGSPPLRPYPGGGVPGASSARRAYSRGGSKDGAASSDNRHHPPPPPLYRSRTAYYDILRVTPNATQAQIKTAYYKQSFVCHPDKNPDSKDAAERFSEVSEAYRVLGSVALRRKYDRGMLSQAEVRSAGRPSARENMAAAGTAGSAQQQQQQQRSRRYSNVGGKPMFDFDAFYRAHYGEQLRRERQAREKEALRKRREEDLKKWKKERVAEITAGALLLLGGLLLLSLRS